MHQNNVIHLDGGIEDDGRWKNKWENLICLPTQLYDVLYGRVRKLFVETLVAELDRIWNRH